MSERIREFAPAKINLFLHVGDKRPDGYHALQSLVAFADIGDELVFEASDKLTLSIEGPCAPSLLGNPPGDNLVLRAARALANEAATAAAAQISLTKNLPVASGLGGGSADAAATLRGLNQLWGMNMGDDQLRRIAESLGSDVPACVASSTCWMEGRGEVLSLAPRLPKCFILLVNPGVSVSTAEVFAKLRDRTGVARQKPPSWSSIRDLVAYLETSANDLETPAHALAPIDDVLAAIRACDGALLARMAGSGATCFGLFETRDAVQAAAAKLSSHANWWIAAGLV